MSLVGLKVTKEDLLIVIYGYFFLVVIVIDQGIDLIWFSTVNILKGDPNL